MPDPQNPGQDQSIDLSSGLVPKQSSGIDLSAGMVPKPQQAPGMHGSSAPQDIGNAVTGVLSGIGGAALKTGQGISNMIGGPILHAMGQEVPQLSPEMTEPRNTAETIGAAAENVGEFEALPENMILRGLSKMAKAGGLADKGEALLAMAEKYPKTARIFTSAEKGGVQAGAKAAGENKPVLPAMEAGAVGGAVGGTVAEGVGAAAKPVAKKMGLGTSDAEDIMRAAKPGKRNDRFLQDWDLAKDRYAAELDENGKFKDLGEAADRMRDVRQKLWNDEVKPVITKHSDEDLLAKPDNAVSSAVRGRITKAMEKVSPQKAESIEQFAQVFDKPMKVGEAEGMLEHLNAELTDSGYWKKTPSERAAADKANPEVAARSAAVGALRDALYDHLDGMGEKGMKELKQTYGAMANVEREVRGQVNVSGRQVPLSLKQIIGLASGHPVTGLAAATLDKIYNDPAAILNRAVNKSQPAGPVKAVAKDLVSGAGSVAKAAAPVAGEWIAVQASDGKTYKVHPEDLPELQKRDPGAKEVQ